MLGLNYVNTNARSLRPKITSLIDAFSQLDLTFSVVTETWFTDGSKLELESEDLLLGHGLAALTLNRPAGRAGYSHGGVAIIYKDSAATAKVLPFPNHENFEVLCAQLNVRGIKRKLFVIAAYMPPGYRVGRAKACIRHISNLILHIKDKFKDPLISLSGDFNQWEIEKAVEDFPDMLENSGGPTRKDRIIDRCFCNWNDCIISTTVRAPLETESQDGLSRKSDHKVVLTCSNIEKIPPPNWQIYKYRAFSKEGAKGFIDWASSQEWLDVLNASGSNDKVRKFQAIIDDASDHFFPLKTIRRKQDDLPWINEAARKKIRKKKAVYKDENRSPRWKAIDAELERYLEKRKVKYLAKQRDRLLGPEATRNFFNNVRAFQSVEKPKDFDVRELRPGATDEAVAEEVADYFNQISSEFDPLDPFQIPTTYGRDLPILSVETVKNRLLTFKKPSSKVDGDIFPDLIKPCAASLAIPLSDIFNTITSTKVWPIKWKKEVVTVIPKKGIPKDFSDLRNISCTQLFSKVYESYVLGWAKEEITLKSNQYGGTKGCSTSHMLINIWDEICSNCEDYRSGTVLTAIDYSKAFNRVSFQHCLKAFEKKGASTDIIRLLATFLTNRTMVVKVGNTRSKPRPVNGGCPQGSILGVFLFNVTTDDLEDEILPPPEVTASNTVDTSIDSSIQSDSSRSSASAPMASSPAGGHARLDWTLSPLGGGRFRVRDMELVFERGTRNMPPINYSDEGLVTPPVETPVGTQVLIDKEIVIAKYIDDNISVEKLNFGSTPATISSDGSQIKEREAPKSQNAFRSITKRAGWKGMKVNAMKTQILVVSDALKYRPIAYIRDQDGNKITSGESMRVLGFNFSTKPTMHAHVDSILVKMRQKYWVLRHLKKLGFNPDELVRVYRSLILPVADYCDVVYHSLLTDEHDEALERAQVGALRTIFDYKQSGRKLRELAGVSTLRSRRIEHVDKFAQKCTQSQFSHWFPKNEVRENRRNNEQYVEYYARCDRLKNSPLFFMRRRLNGKAGKTYGERNRVFRES